MQTVVDCIEHQDKILVAYRNGESKEARRIARNFLTKMKEYLGTRLVSTT